MALLPKSFIPSQVKESALIPKGWYQGKLVKSAVKVTKSKTGKYLDLKFVIDDESSEEHKRPVFTMLNIVNDNPKAVEIGDRQLKELCAACGLDEDEELEDTESLHDVLIWIRVSIQEGSNDYPDKNTITGYRPIDWQPPQKEED